MKWAIHIKNIDDVARMIDLMSGKGAKLLGEFDYEHCVATVKAKTKVMTKLATKARIKGIKFDFLDYRTYRFMRKRKSKKINSRKEPSYGKTLSSPIGMVGEVRNTEKNCVPMGEERKAGGDDIDVPDADTGRPAGSGKEPGYSQVEVSGSRVDKAFTTFVDEMIPPIAKGYSQAKVPGTEVDTMEITELIIPNGNAVRTFDEYAKRYSVPVRTLRKWVANGTVKSWKDKNGRLRIQDGPKYPFKASVPGIPATNLRWKWLGKEAFESMKQAERPSDGI